MYISAPTVTAAATAAAAAATAAAGDGFVLNDAAITAYQLSDPKPFLSSLLQRPYFNRVLLAPHLLSPATSGAVLDTPGDLVVKMNSSWGLLAREGFCNGTDCFRIPVVAGEKSKGWGAGASLQSIGNVSITFSCRLAVTAGATSVREGWRVG
jgi:hypothetical protein